MGVISAKILHDISFNIDLLKEYKQNIVQKWEISEFMKNI